jgi:predicted phosphohydrolase
MARLFALADLHLSGTGDKPMDVFGELWRDHSRRMAEAWDSSVQEGDTVLLPGDLSWARNVREAEADLRWIENRPGRKLLLKGNHDSWWPSLTRLGEILSERCEVLQNNALEFGEWVIVGARGWTSPDDPFAEPGDERIFRRELGRLRASIEDARRRFGRARPRLAMVHYPPWLEGQQPTEVVDLLQDAGVRVCVYGHLHGDDHARAVVGARRGIEFCFVAADAVGFRPYRIRLPQIDGNQDDGGSEGPEDADGPDRA